MLKPLNFTRPHFGWRIKLAAMVGALIIALGITTLILKAINAWYDTHTLTFKPPIVIEFNKPISIEERKVPTTEIIKVVEQIPEPQDLNTDIEKYIYQRFGAENYKIAYAIFKAESGLREDAIHVNSGGSIDIGIAQINSTHWKQAGCSLKELVDAEKNIDCAYTIWQASGWDAWSSKTNGSFKEFIK